MSDEKKKPFVPFVPAEDDSAAYTAMLAQIARSNAYTSAQANSVFSGRGPGRGENENGAFFRLGNNQPVALAGDYRRNAPWKTVSGS